ncbi:hypothetical protein QQS21_003847 [Conoideocrella luteorostrata]|uniref:NACHT domain-containing protein n=1 Tax=Conoideocrella luteorostrata TaxID=1105319 RepID=A0AAJ0CSL0_9HYPO|nr:hypothetical protein QQS21_003847 [Conoideocrella luteorostrata]
MTSRKALESPDYYAVAWIAALPIERAAAEAMLDEEHAAPTGFNRHPTDANIYTWGCMGEHNIVIASLAAGVYGTTSAATTASSLLASLPSIRIGFFVGIGGGIARPDGGHDIRLGDIVVSQPDGTTGGVYQYDLIKAKSGDKRERKGFLGRPPIVLLNALSRIQAVHERKDSKVPCFLQEMLEKNPKMSRGLENNPDYVHQGLNNDRLFKSSYNHISGLDCRGCNTADEVKREPRDTTEPKIHYGTIASGNTLVEDAATRDRIIADVGEDCICFEMEAAGLMNHFPCLVIRGICDYADSHKNDRWQRYASATAAAYAKELLTYVPAAEVQETKRALEVLRLRQSLVHPQGQFQQQINGVQRTAIATKATTESIKAGLHTDSIKRWLCPPDPSTNANHARKLRHDGTGAWLLDNPVFQEWYLGLRRHLWLNGLAGYGKTVLSATILDYISKDNNSLILSFFFDFSDRTKQTLDGLLRSLAYQIYQGGSTGLLDAMFQANQNSRDEPNTKTLEDIVRKMLTIQKKGTIILDALDEATTRHELLSWIKDFVSRPELSHIQLIYTGRPETEFLREIPLLIGQENCLALNKESINADIQSYVAAQLLQRPDFQNKPLSQELLNKIRRKVGGGADGMWAFCQLDSLARCPHEAAIEETLVSLPRNLEETYQRMINHIPTEFKNDAIRLLQFLVHSKRPLTLAEAKEVIATQIEHKQRGFNTKRRLFREIEILTYCPGLVTIHAADKELHLAHFSVKEYLLGEKQFNITIASISITTTCLTYLTDINGSHEKIIQNFPMARYAAEIWTAHAALAQNSEDIVRAAVEFLETEVTFRRWAQLYQADKSWDHNPGLPQCSRLYYTCLEGLVVPARILIDKGADVNAQGGYYGNALQVASYKGHQEIVQLLLEKGADVNAQGGYHGNALLAALYEGYQEIALLLLEKGADVNAQGGYYGNALLAASYKGYQKIVQLLLEKGADINAQGGQYGNALLAASYKGYRGIAQLLLEKGADVNAQGGYFGNALQAASMEGYQEIVQLLLKKGADVNAQGGYYDNALQAASIRGNQKIAQLLLEKGAHINAQGG